MTALEPAKPARTAGARREKILMVRKMLATNFIFARSEAKSRVEFRIEYCERSDLYQESREA